MLLLRRLFVTFYFLHTHTPSHYFPCSSLSRSAIYPITNVKVTAKKAGKKVSKTLKATVTVKNPSLTLKAASEVAVGSKETVKATVKPANTKVTFASSDETIATVDATTGEVTGVKAGTVTITAKAGKTTKTVTMTVKNYVFKSVTQKTAKTVEAVILGSTKNLKKADFAVTNTATKAVVAVEKIAVDEKDATKVTITTFADMADGKVYSVALDGTTQEFTATDGKVASLEVTPVQIPSGTATKIEMVAKDANNVVVYQAPYGSVDSAYSFTIETKTGYTQGDSLYLTKTGDTATAKVVKHSYKYDTTGKEIETIESGDITITAVDPAAVSGFQVRVADDNTKKFDDVKANSQIPVGGSKVAMFKITDANGKELSSYGSNYAVSSSDATIMQIAGTINGSAVGDGVSIYGLKEGTAYILVKDTNNNNTVVASLPITVVAAAKPATLTLDKTSLTVSNVAAVNESVVAVATVKDQYGNDFDISSDDVTVENTAKPAIPASGTALTGSASGKTITFAGKDTVKGTYVFKVTYTKNNVTTSPAYVTVVVKEATGNVDYALDGDKSAIDTKITASQKDTTPVTFNLYETKGSVKSSKVTTGITYEVKKDNKTVFSNGTTPVTNDFISESTGVLTINALVKTGDVITKIPTGDYTVIATYTTGSGATKKDYTRSATLKVTDTQAAVTIDQKANKAAASTTAKAILGDTAIFTIANKDSSTIAITKVEGACAAKSLAAGSDLTSQTFDAGDVVTISKVTANVTIEGVTYEMSVNVNFVITIQ